VEEGCPPFYGKYRGTVTNPTDLTGRGRVQVSVPDVLGDNTFAWAMPASPFAGPGIGFFSVPPKDASVWVEFERGDPDYPIWSGCFWEVGQEPAGVGPLASLQTLLKTKTFTLKADHNPAVPTLLLEMNVGGAAGVAKIEANMSGMTIECAGNTIRLGPDGVSINKTNLKVLK
jgi:hypothetical protein